MAYKVSKDIADKACSDFNSGRRKGVYFEVCRANAENTLFYVSEYERDHKGVVQFKGQVFINESDYVEAESGRYRGYRSLFVVEQVKGATLF